MTSKKKAAVFIMLGQSNAVGHGVPMVKEDRIDTPLKNVFGLSREKNQSFGIKGLSWEGYTSGGMNLAEEQDHTYSVPNLLAKLWQNHIDDGNEYKLPDLYIVQIAIGAQGVTSKYMWYPERQEKLVPGKLGTVDISLFPFCKHIFSLLDESFASREIDYEIIGLHWRGGEEEMNVSWEELDSSLETIYRKLFDTFTGILGDMPIILHRIVAKDRAFNKDPSGEKYEKMQLVNSVFDKIAAEKKNTSVFDVRCAPMYKDDVVGNGLFISDAVHFTPEVNEWVAKQIMEDYVKKYNGGKKVCR